MSGFAILPLETGADKELDTEDVKADSGLFLYHALFCNLAHA